jgi:hypothetical protein
MFCMQFGAFLNLVPNTGTKDYISILAVIQIRMDPHQSDKSDSDPHQFADDKTKMYGI